MVVWGCGIFRERKHRKSPDGGKSDSSGSFRTSSDNVDREKAERYPSSDEKNPDYEAQVGLNYAIYLVDIITYMIVSFYIYFYMLCS